MTPDNCDGAWSVERAMREPSTWLGVPDPEDCDVTKRMLCLLRVALDAVHAAGAPRPSVWRGTGSIILDWRWRWRRTSSWDHLRIAQIDVEDDVDDKGAVGCGSFYAFRDSASPTIFVGWNEENIAHIASVIVGFLRGAPIRWVAEQVPGAVGNGMRVDSCDDFATGPYTCRVDPVAHGHTPPPTNAGACQVSP